MSEPKTCKWHGCRREFTPKHGKQEYCTPKCRVDMLDWKKSYGPKIVTALMETPLSELNATMRRERRRLEALAENMLPKQ